VATHCDVSVRRVTLAVNAGQPPLVPLLAIGSAAPSRPKRPLVLDMPLSGSRSAAVDFLALVSFAFALLYIKGAANLVFLRNLLEDIALRLQLPGRRMWSSPVDSVL
jgi:hypothetical protein